MTDLVDVLGRIRQGLSQNEYENEAAVSAQIVRPVLQALRWDVYDPRQVRAEYQLKGRKAPRRVDLALCPSGGDPQCLIEVKATWKQLKQIGQTDPDWQLFEYAFHAGALVGLLTNGGKWHFYSMQSAGPDYENRRVCALDVESDSLEEVAAALDRYLSFTNIKTGRSAEFAREDLKQRINQSRAREAIPQAWARLVEGDLGDDLVTLLIEATAVHMDGEVTPTKEDVASFLRKLKEGTTIGPPPPPPPPPPPTGRVHYWLLGEERTARNAREAYIDVFQTLAERYPDFLERVSTVLRGRRTCGVARTQREISLNEAVSMRAAPLPGGWWLHTNLSNLQKVQFLKKACDVSRIQFGQNAGLKISLPNS